MADIDPNLLSHIADRDVERRRIGFASMRAKLASVKIVLEAAERLATEAEVTHVYQCQTESQGQQDITAVQAQVYCQSEAIYAATVEIIKNLELVQILTTKLSGIKSVPQLEGFSKAIEAGGPVPRA